MASAFELSAIKQTKETQHSCRRHIPTHVRAQAMAEATVWVEGGVSWQDSAPVFIWNIISQQAQI